MAGTINSQIDSKDAHVFVDNSKDVSSVPAFVVNDKYKIYPDTRLPAFDYPNAKAYLAKDMDNLDRAIFALVCDPRLPVRKEHIKGRVGKKIEGLLTLVGAELIYSYTYARKTFVLFYEMPLGGRVSFTSKNDRILPEEIGTKISRWIRPLLLGVNNLSQMGLSHREVRLNNLFYLDAEKTKVVLGDCISAPAAFNQPAIYETIENAMCQPQGRAAGNILDDLYSLGVTLLFLELGYNPVERLPDRLILENKIKKGSYATLVGDARVSLAMIELLRGLLIDNSTQRWDVTSALLWADGRRLTPIQPKMAKSSQRPFIFDNIEFFSYRLLANAFVYNWAAAAKAIKSERFSTWLIRGLDDKKTAEQVENIINSAQVLFSVKEKQEDFIVAKVCMLLDPAAPLRTSEFSFFPSALNNVLAFYVHSEEQLKKIVGLISTGFVEAWYEIAKDKSMQQRIKSMQRTIQKTEKGEGIERVLYDLSEYIPCQSPLIEDYYVDDVHNLLPALEEAADNLRIDADLFDAHIAAFVSVQLTGKLQEEFLILNSRNESSAILGTLTILSKLQQSFGPNKLPNISRWIAGNIDSVVKSYHNLDRQKYLEKNLQKYIRKGDLLELLLFLETKDERRSDGSGFANAKKEYLKLEKQINYLSVDRTERIEESLVYGNHIAAVFSLSIAILTMFSLLVLRFMG